jgi:hypothetical protein
MKPFISLIFISLLIFASIIIIQQQEQQVYAGKDKDKDKEYRDYNGDGITEYTTWEGKKIDESEYMQRMAYCVDMALGNQIDINTKCGDWVLTYEGETKLIDYVLEENDIDTSEEKLDFWLDQLDN